MDGELTQQDQSLSAAVRSRGVPSNSEAEMFVLGSVLLDQTKLAQVVGHLDTDDFFFEKHRRIFDGMREISSRGEPIEYLTLANQLAKSNTLKKVGGVTYLASLTDGMPRIENIESYVGIVKEKSILRQLIQVSEGIISNCIQQEQEIDQILSESESAISKVGDSLLRAGLESPREILADFEGGIDAFLDPSKRRLGLTTPFIRFDELTNGMRGGQLIVLAGRPAMGKTAIALNIAYHVASERPGKTAHTVAVFSLEMSKEALLTRVLCAEARVDQRRFRGGYLNAGERAKLSAALTGLVESRLFIDDTASLSLLELASKCRRLQSSHGLDLVIVDYLQLLATPGRVESRVQEISAFSRGLKLLASELDVPVVALSQLSRAPENPRRKDGLPKLSDLRDSGSIEQDADVVCFVYRKEVYRPDDKTFEGTAELIIGKQRNGPTGSVKLAFLKQFARFENLEEDLGDGREDESPF